MLTWIKLSIKLLLFFIALGLYILRLLIWLRIKPTTEHHSLKLKHRQLFCQFANRLFGIQINLEGHLPHHSNYLVISNHRTVYDPIALLSIVQANPVSKAEVGNYPLIGWGAKLTEIIFVERNNRRQRGLTQRKIYKELRDGKSILVFPEGTTGTQSLTQNFKKGSFEAAVEADKAVIPITIEYSSKDLYWGEQSTFDHFKNLLFETPKENRKIWIKIHDPMKGSTAIELLQLTQSRINQSIVEIRSQIKSFDHK